MRQARRLHLIQAALAPARKRMGKGVYDRLCAALSMVFGAESMIIYRDVVPLDDRATRRVKDWAVEALVRAALAESSGSGGGRRRSARR